MNLVVWFSFFCLIFSSLIGSQQDEALYKKPTPSSLGDTLWIRGLSLMEESSEKAPQTSGISIDLKGRNYEDLKERLFPYLNQQLDPAILQQIKNTIIDYFQEVCHEYAMVQMPNQEVKNGIVAVQVKRARVGEISFEGACWFSSKALARALDIREGDCLDQNRLLNYLSWLNQNPFLRAQAVLTPGAPGKADIQVLIHDHFPLRLYAGSDNLGLKQNGTVQLYTGFNWGNALRLGDLLSFQYTASTDFHQFQSFVVSYISFLSWKHLLTAYSGYATIFPEVEDFHVEGKNFQASLRYQIPIKPLYGSFRNACTFGFDYKYLNSNLFFVAADTGENMGFTTNNLNITQFLFLYELKKNWPRQMLVCRLELIGSLWKSWWIPHQTTAAYELLRLGSHPRYGYAKFFLADQYQTEKGWVFAGHVRAQGALDTLPSSEQFGLGGADTVRGYLEQQFSADDAVCGNLEVYTPKLCISPRFDNAFVLVAFFDAAYGYNYTFLSEEFKDQTLLGTGIGARYDIVPYFSSRLDYGFKLRDIPGDNRFGRLHFSVNASY